MRLNEECGSAIRLSADVEVTREEAEAALRCIECWDDGCGADVGKPMMRRLRELGLIVHLGGGVHEGTDSLHELEGIMRRSSSTPSRNVSTDSTRSGGNA